MKKSKNCPYNAEKRIFDQMDTFYEVDIYYEMSDFTKWTRHNICTIMTIIQNIRIFLFLSFNIVNVLFSFSCFENG